MVLEDNEKRAAARHSAGHELAYDAEPRRWEMQDG